MTEAAALWHTARREPSMSGPGRRSAAAGLLGPTAFVAAWSAGALVADGLSPVHDAISRLAAIGAPTRPLMTTGFVVFGVSLPVYACALRRWIPGPAWIAAAATGLSTIGVACTPLDRSATVDTLHAVFAGVGYVTLAVTPVLAARPLQRLGRDRLARAGHVAGAVSATALMASIAGLPTGLFQRLGLTAADAWIVASAAAMLTAGRTIARPS
jgi:hypothetical membrane protein